MGEVDLIKTSEGGQYLFGGGDDADQDLVVFSERVEKLTVSSVFTVGKIV